MKKNLKKLIITVIVLIIIWIIFFSINFIKSTNLEEPILMMKTSFKHVTIVNDEDGNTHELTSHEYTGIMYKIETEREGETIVRNRLYLFGNLLNETSRFQFN